MNQSATDPSNPNMPKKCPQCGNPLPTGALEGLCPACLLAQGTAPETSSEAAPFQPPTIEEMARLFPQLEILELVGKGGMGAVYKARQPALDRFVALKILPPQAASGPGFPERFSREARALAKLAHPNIVAVHEFGQVNGLPFFIMEFVDGLNLRELERAGKLSPREALQIVPQICEALQFAHDEGIVHRDIKPENILLDKKGRVKIADFGIAKIMGRESDAALTETKGAIGTPQYMAPEQVEKPQEVDHRADIFSLGVVFYEMLTGELPLGKFAPPSRRVEVDVRLDEVVLRSLEKEPERRYQQASEVKTALETISATAAPTPADAQALAREVLGRDYVLDIGSCLSRGWALVRSDFWPVVGITALILLLLQAACSTAIGLVVGGPLMGGLWLYYLKRIRCEAAALDTAFSGFRLAFAQLLLAGLVTFLLTLLGFICLILPGIYLLVVWMFALALVVDNRLDFWPAMELSRKVISKRWWKFLGFWLVLLLINVVGLVPFGLGLLITVPISLAATMYAYEEVFGAARGAASQPSPRLGPFGTAVLPGTAAGGFWKPVVIGLAALMLVLGLIAAASFFHRAARHQRSASYLGLESAGDRIPEREPEAASPAFGPVVELVLTMGSDTSDFLDLDTGEVLHHSAGLNFVGSDVAPQTDELVPWVRENGVDAGVVTNNSSLTPELVLFDVGIFSFGRDTNIWDALQADRLVSGELGYPSLTNKHWAISFYSNSLSSPTIFETREGALGLLEMLEYTDDPGGIKIRYKLVEHRPGSASASERKALREGLAERLDAASTISGPGEKDRALAMVALDAAKAGEMAIVMGSLGRISRNTARDQAAQESAHLLASAGLSRQAIETAALIVGSVKRDQTFAELARGAAKAAEAEHVTTALSRIASSPARDQTALESARLLANAGLRKQAIQIAKTISNSMTRDRALSELAQ